jgi:hypothetical protein
VSRLVGSTTDSGTLAGSRIAPLVQKLAEAASPVVAASITAFQRRVKVAANPRKAATPRPFPAGQTEILLAKRRDRSRLTLLLKTAPPPACTKT